MGFWENITDPRNLSNSTSLYNYSSDVVYIQRSKTYDLGEISVFISAVLLSLGGCFAIVASNIRRSRCISIDCGVSKCSRKIPDDTDIAV